MNKWNMEKLEEMKETQNPYIKTKLNYPIIAQKYEEIIQKLTENGDAIPLALKDVETTYNGKIDEDIKQPEINIKIQKKLEENQQKQQIMHIKHFSRGISHETWYKYLEDEITTFIKKYPEYSEIILN